VRGGGRSKEKGTSRIKVTIGEGRRLHGSARVRQLKGGKLSKGDEEKGGHPTILIKAKDQPSGFLEPGGGRKSCSPIALLKKGTT